MLYLPDFPCEWALSRWTGRPQGLRIDPLGVECFVPPPPARRGLFGRRKPDAAASLLYLHVLVHDELASDRIRSWAQMQVARLAAVADEPDATGDRLNRLTEAEAARLADRDWTPSTVTVDGVQHPGSAFVAAPDRWAVYVEAGHDRIAIIARALDLSDLRLRTASGEEARQIRTAALRV